ncbi:MAG TPA: hypothetical protein VGF24_33720 [Vicinamibacterales bacterium]
MDLDDRSGGRFASTRIVRIEYVDRVFRVIGRGFTCAADAVDLVMVIDRPDYLEFAAPMSGQRFTISRLVRKSR